jgi:phosphohistidine phosphatase
VKRIYVLRHGKSDWNAEYGADHERPLKGRGVRAARLMGHFLTATGQEPDMVVSSSAVRALTTARLAAEAGDWGCDVRVEPGLYGASRTRALQEIQSLDTAVDSVLLAGHEPTCSDVVGSLIGSAEIRFPTAAMACIDVPAPRWDAVEFGRGFLVWFVTPKLLAGSGFDND